MYTVHFKDVYGALNVPIREDSPEIRFMRHICSGGKDVDSYFNETTIYRHKTFIDAPSGHYEGFREMEQFSEEWLKLFHASDAEVYPVIQTVSGGRSATEMEIWFRLNGEVINKVPVTVFGDLAPGNKLEGLRIYYFFKFQPGAVSYRPPIFRPGVNKPTESALMTGVMRYYYEQLHNYRYEESFANMKGMIAKDCIYGGYRPDEEEPMSFGRDAIAEHYKGICMVNPDLAYIRFETIVDDGIRMAVEWTGIPTKEGLKKGFISIAGCAVYDRNSDGELASIRINDNTGFDLGVDPSSIPAWNNFIAEL